MSLRVTAVVPMRHHSERVAGKNYRLCDGRPLFHHIIGTLLACPAVAKVVVDTDSPVIRDGVADHFPTVQLLERPPHLRDGAISMNDVLLNVLGQVEGDLFLQTHTTNPLLRAATVARALQEFARAGAPHDSLFAVTRIQARLWSADGRPLNHDPRVLRRTQDLPPTLLENSCLYVFDRAGFERRRNRIGASPLLFEIPSDEAWDIDTEFDFTVAETLLRIRHQS